MPSSHAFALPIVWQVWCRAAGALGLALLVPGCARRESPSAAAIAAQRLNFDNEADPHDLDPHTETGALERRIIASLFEGLLARDPQDSRVIPALARSWEISEDGRTFTFHLRTEARWTDGTPVTAPDYVATFQRLFSPALGCEYRVRYYAIAGAQDFAEGRRKDFKEVGVKALAAHTLQFTLFEPCSYFLDQLTEAEAVILPIRHLAKFGGLERRGTAWTKPENLIGNGAFRLKEWRPQQRVVVEKSETYWNAASVQLREVVFHPVDALDVVERMFRTGALQIARIPPAKIAAYEQDRPELLWRSTAPRTSFVVPNVKRPPLNDPRVRRALAAAIDRERLAGVLRNGSLPARTLTPSGLDEYRAEPRLTEDVALARQLLADAGYPGGKGLRPLNLLFAERHNAGGVLEVLQEMWRSNLGIEIRLSREEWKVFLDSEKNGQYDLAADGWTALTACSFYDLVTTHGSELSWYFWRQPAYDRLYAEAARTLEQKKRHAIYRQLDQVLADEMPLIPLYHHGVVMLVHPAVQGYHKNWSNDHPLKAISYSAGK